MKFVLFFLYSSFFTLGLMGQDKECYSRLLQRGVEEYNKNNFAQAILKWQTAKDDCPDVTVKEKNVLEAWITKARDKQTALKKNILAAAKNLKTYVKHDTVYIDKPVKKIVYVDRPVEKIVYVDKPERYHIFGKGNGKVFIYTTCNTGGATKVWIDGEYVGSFDRYFTTAPDCNQKEFDSAQIARVVLSGKHHIQTKNENGGTTNFYIIVYEDNCQLQKIACD